jgi:hypothetical protein
MRAPDSSNNSKYGAGLQEPQTGAVSIFKMFPPKPHLHEPRVVGSQYGAITGAAESLIAQPHSQSKLTTPRGKNRKIRHKNEILKANELGVGT